MDTVNSVGNSRGVWRVQVLESAVSRMGLMELKTVHYGAGGIDPFVQLASLS